MENLKWLSKENIEKIEVVTVDNSKLSTEWLEKNSWFNAASTEFNYVLTRDTIDYSVLLEKYLQDNNRPDLIMSKEYYQEIDEYVSKEQKIWELRTNHSKTVNGLTDKLMSEIEEIRGKRDGEGEEFPVKFLDFGSGCVDSGLFKMSTLENKINAEKRILSSQKKHCELVKSQKFSFIDTHEEQEAKDFIEKHLKFPPPRVAGFWMCVKIHYDEKDIHEAKDDDGKQILRPDGTPVVFYLPESANPHEKYKSCTALVVSQGPDSYKGERFNESGPWCKVGDWIVIPPNEGYYLVYRGIPMRIIADDKCLSIVEDPTYVTRI